MMMMNDTARAAEGTIASEGQRRVIPFKLFGLCLLGFLFWFPVGTLGLLLVQTSFVVAVTVSAAKTLIERFVVQSLPNRWHCITLRNIIPTICQIRRRHLVI